MQINNIFNSIEKSYGETSDENLIYSVTFRNKRKTYYYFAGNKEYRVGQYVIAPAGRYYEPAVVKIVAKEKLDGQSLPIPKEYIKTIDNCAIQ